MFQIQENDSVDFESSWKNDKTTQDAEQQTTEFSVKDQDTMTLESKSVEIQTDNSKQSEITDFDMDKLAEWLKKIYPQVDRELNDNSLSDAIAATNYYDKQCAPESSVLQIINAHKDENEIFYVSSLSWNCTGNTLAVSCCYKHESWCFHQGEIKIYTFDRDDKLPENPIKNLICNSCVTCVCFHKTNSSILCAGTLYGEIYMWNVYNDNDDDCLLTMVNGHEDKVTMLSWITTIDSKQSMLLATSSLDANLILWQVSIQDSTLETTHKYKINRILMPRHSSSRDSEFVSKKSDKGILCFDFSTYIPGLFILGTEGGFVLKCSMMGAQTISGESNSALDPFLSTYEGHLDEITDIQFSPHRKELFFSSGYDDEIRIYHIEQVTPVQIIFVQNTLSRASWILHEEKLMVGCSKDGSIKIYSLRDGQHIPNTVLKEKDPLTAIAINIKRENMLAVGNTSGTVQLWSMPWNDIAQQDHYNMYKKKM